MSETKTIYECETMTPWLIFDDLMIDFSTVESVSRSDRGDRFGTTYAISLVRKNGLHDTVHFSDVDLRDKSWEVIKGYFVE